MWKTKLVDIIDVPYNEPRCFSRKIKEELYRANPYCAICGQHISSIDDAAVDHIEQYWLGGRTIPENARLTHRFCNSSRSRFDKPNILVELQEAEETEEQELETLTIESVIEEGVVTGEVLINLMREQ